MHDLLIHLTTVPASEQGRALARAADELLAAGLIPLPVAQRARALAAFEPRREMPDPWLEAAKALVPPVSWTDTGVAGPFPTGYDSRERGGRHSVRLWEDDGNPHDVWDVCDAEAATEALGLAACAVLCHLIARDGYAAWGSWGRPTEDASEEG